MKKKVFYLVLVVVLLIGIITMFIEKDKSIKLEINLVGKTVEEAKEYASNNNLELEVIEEYNENEKNIVYKQEIEDNTIMVYVSLGPITEETYKEYKVNELGNVPIMMYHGIQNITNNIYTGGNIDEDGYQRTASAFREDLEFYYNSGYRMIKLSDYIEGNIDVKLGKSPIILTFDDGLENNIKVTGLDDSGNIIVDPNSAVGILEEFKKKYPDYNVSATFFINAELFNQSEYNEKILKWLVDNNYSIGNHSYSHADFSKIDSNETEEEVGKMYELLESIIPGRYEYIVALPFGSPYTINNNNFKHILNGANYQTISTLRVGWESEYSPFHKSFDKTFLKRIRAYDNNGLDFDIEMNFKLLENNKYISDGNINTVVIPENSYKDMTDNIQKQVITY